MLFIILRQILKQGHLCLLWAWKKKIHSPVSSDYCNSLYFSPNERHPSFQWHGETLSWKAQLGKRLLKNHLVLWDTNGTASCICPICQKQKNPLHLKAKNKEMEHFLFTLPPVCAAHILPHEQWPTTSFLTRDSLSDTMSFSSAMICRSSGRLSLFLNFSSVPSSL